MARCAGCGEAFPCSDAKRLDISGRERAKHYVQIDVRVIAAGNLVQLFLNTASAKAWVHDNVDAPDYMWLGGDCVCVEHRYVEDIIAGMQDAGLEVA